MFNGREEFWRAALARGYPVAAEPEGGGFSCAGNFTPAGVGFSAGPWGWGARLDAAGLGLLWSQNGPDDIQL